MWDSINMAIATQAQAFTDLFAALFVMAAPKIAVLSIFAIKIYLMYTSYIR